MRARRCALSSRRARLDSGIATVTYADRDGTEKTVTIVGIDEADLDQGQVSWVSPIARALMKAHEGDVVELRTPSGIEPIEIVEIRYRDDALS